jgi:hypothetical protein
MQTLKVSVSLPDDTHADMQVRLSAGDSDCDVVIALPVHPARTTPSTPRPAASSTPTAEDDYVLGGYAGI